MLNLLKLLGSERVIAEDIFLEQLIGDSEPHVRKVEGDDVFALGKPDQQSAVVRGILRQEEQDGLEQLLELPRGTKDIADKAWLHELDFHPALCSEGAYLVQGHCQGGPCIHGEALQVIHVGIQSQVLLALTQGLDGVLDLGLNDRSDVSSLRLQEVVSPEKGCRQVDRGKVVSKLNAEPLGQSTLHLKKKRSRCGVHQLTENTSGHRLLQSAW